MVEDYWILLDCSEEDSAIITGLPDDCPEAWEILEGGPIADQFPEKINLRFSKKYPKNIKLYDFVANTKNIRIISERTKQVFDGLRIEQVEYIPVTLYDHNDDIAGENYYICHIINRQPIIDTERSEYRVSPLDENKIDRVNLLHVNLQAIDPDAKLFRSARQDVLYCITSEVVNAMQAAGITGIRVIKAEGWDGNKLVF